MMKYGIVTSLLFLLLTLSGCGVMVRGVVSGGRAIGNSALFHQGRHGPLTEQEKKWAAAAWQYFLNNTDPETGLVNGSDQYPAASMWHVADALAALVAARELDMIDRCAFDERLSRILHFLNTMPLTRAGVPNTLYHVQTGDRIDNEMQTRDLGWSAVDLGRLLLWLRIVRCRYPVFAEYVDKAVLRWNFCYLIDNCGTLYGGFRTGDRIRRGQEGRLGYEEYAARGFRLWGFDTRRAASLNPSREVDIHGIRIPVDERNTRTTGTAAPVLSLGRMLDGLEFNWDRLDDTESPDSRHTAPRLAKEAEALYRVQEARYRKEGILTARTDHQLPEAPFFVYDSIFAEGYPWNVLSPSGEYTPDAALVAVRAAFPVWSLWKTPYTDRLMESVSCLYSPEQGWYEGRWEKTGGYARAVTASTNAMVLESLLYKATGKLFGCRPPAEGHYSFILGDAFQRTDTCLPPDQQACP